MTDSVIIKIVNLTDTERRIAYNYQMQMCRTGKINGVNSQISNILKQAGVIHLLLRKIVLLLSIHTVTR